jgi:excisionase family DNA binding protein
MTEQSERTPKGLTSSIRLPPLSPAASAFVRQYPNQAQLAVTVALEAAAAQFAARNTIESEIPASLRPFIIEASPLASSNELIGPEEAAQWLNVSRATIYNWIESRRLIGWRLTRQGTLIPAEQIVGSGELVAGIEQILQLIPEPRAAWRFLAEESQLFDRPQRPIDSLKAGKTNEVIAAARASGEAFT